MSCRLDRLKRRSEFLRVARRGRRFAAPGLVLQVRRSPPEDATKGTDMRVGFTVSKKVGNAVERNRVRRRLRAAAGEVLPTCARRGNDYVIIGRRAALTRGFAELMDDLRTALARTDATLEPGTGG